MSRTTVTPDQLFAIDSLLTGEEREIGESVRGLVQRVIAPHIASWYERGELPVRDLATELGSLGLLGMHLHGYGCAGTSALAYGLACLELEQRPCRDGVRVDRSAVVERQLLSGGDGVLL